MRAYPLLRLRPKAPPPRTNSAPARKAERQTLLCRSAFHEACYDDSTDLSATTEAVGAARSTTPRGAECLAEGVNAEG
jgi:hypothetical protein